MMHLVTCLQCEGRRLWRYSHVDTSDHITIVANVTIFLDLLVFSGPRLEILLPVDLHLLVNLENIQVKSANQIISIAISNAPIVVGGP